MALIGSELLFSFSVVRLVVSHSLAAMVDCLWFAKSLSALGTPMMTGGVYIVLASLIQTLLGQRKVP